MLSYIDGSVRLDPTASLPLHDRLRSCSWTAAGSPLSEEPREHLLLPPPALVGIARRLGRLPGLEGWTLFSSHGFACQLAGHPNNTGMNVPLRIHGIQTRKSLYNVVDRSAARRQQMSEEGDVMETLEDGRVVHGRAVEEYDNGGLVDGLEDQTGFFVCFRDFVVFHQCI